jgi:hypothetical protein
VDEAGFVNQPERDDDTAAAARDLAAGVREPLVAQVGCLVERELEPDRIERHDRGKHRGGAGSAAGDEIARRHAAVADAAGHRRPQLGELQIELGLAYRRLVRQDRRFGVAFGLRTLLEYLLADGLVAHELLAARVIGLGVGQIRTRELEIGAGLVERVLERPLVDREQEITLLHDLSVVEMHAIEIAGDAGADLDRIDRNETTDILVIVDDVALDRACHRHRRRRWRGRSLLALAASGEHGSEDRKEDGGADVDFHFFAVTVRPLRRCTI